MKRARTLLPTDLLALAMASGRTYRNEARPLERLVKLDNLERPLVPAVEQWLSPRGNRGVWIAMRRQRLLGLVSARPRGTRQAWEIDRLIDTTPGMDAVPALIERAVNETGRGGAEKLFLRLSATSRLLPVAKAAGFLPYQEETLYRRKGQITIGPAPDMRPFARQDLYSAFRLYNRVTPHSVRRCEAVTFGEWQAAQERRWLKYGDEFVLDSERGLSAHLRVASVGEAVVFDLLVDEESIDRVPEIAAVAAEEGASQMFTVVAASAEAVARRLEEIGFEPIMDLVSLYHRTTRPVRAEKLVPAIAKTAVAP
jgi:hypothetical protein